MESTCCHMGPPRPWVFTVICYCVNIMITAAGVYYTWNFRHPVSHHQKNYYESIIYLFFAFCCLKYLWHELFCNYHHYKYAFALSVAVCMLLTFIGLALTVLYGLQHAIVSSVLFAIITIWFFFKTCWNAYIFYCYCKKSELWCDCHHQHYHYGATNTMQYSQTNYQNTSYSQESVMMQQGGGGGGGPMMMGGGNGQHPHHHKQQHHHKQHHNRYEGEPNTIIVMPEGMGNGQMIQQQPGQNQSQYNPGVQYMPNVQGGGSTGGGGGQNY